MHKQECKDLEETDRRSLIHPFTNLRDYASGESPKPRIIETGDGIYISDREGNRFLDAFAGLYCVNVGYGREEVIHAIADQARKLAYYHAYAGNSNEPAIRLAEKVIELAPKRMSRIFFGLTGSDANETNVKIVWYYNNVLGRRTKKKIIARHRGYHGASVFAGSLTGLPVFHAAFDLPVSGVFHTTTPHHFWEAPDGMSEAEFSRKCALDLEQLILAEGPDTVAAFIGEPVLGTGGLIPPPEGYWREIGAVLRKYDVLLIADEVICGFGRLGANFGSELYGMDPDLMTVAKGLTSGYLPLSASIVSGEICRVLDRGSGQYGPFAHGLTYSAHPICAAAGLANLELIERESLTHNAKVVGRYFQECLRSVFSRHSCVAETRGVGLLAAIEFVADRPSKLRFDPLKKVGATLSAACLNKGLICRAMPHGDILGFAPPLIVNKGDIDNIVDIVKHAVHECLGTS